MHALDYNPTPPHGKIVIWLEVSFNVEYIELRNVFDTGGEGLNNQR